MGGCFCVGKTNKMTVQCKTQELHNYQGKAWLEMAKDESKMQKSRENSNQNLNKGGLMKLLKEETGLFMKGMAS